MITLSPKFILSEAEVAGMIVPKKDIDSGGSSLSSDVIASDSTETQTEIEIESGNESVAKDIKENGASGDLYLKLSLTFAKAYYSQDEQKTQQKNGGARSHKWCHISASPFLRLSCLLRHNLKNSAK